MMAPTTVHLVPHTHWDREWYLPFQAFRLRLVGLLDGLLDEMEADPRLRFTLDGQLATVDDYLEVRPENAERIARLVRSGRLAAGPWLILMDEFLVSGETIVRNLEMGWRRAEALGRAMPVGYLPDMFGHVAQMPQILRRAGITDAVVWRGVPAAIDRHVFAWRSPDGSEVRTEYLFGGYGNARDLFDVPDRVGHKLDVYVGSVRPVFGDDEILAMYGEDHSLPRPGYASLVEGFNTAQDRYRVVIDTLADYLAATRDRAAPARTWEGELRSGARANILMGVVSHRVEVKQAAGRVERLLERTAEPLLALHAGHWPERLLELAWRRVVEDSAHDSICACSTDEVVAQVLVRFAEAERIARGLVAQGLAGLGATAPAGSWVVFNPSPVPRHDVVELDVPLAGGAPALVDSVGTVAPVQPVGRSDRVVAERDLPAAEVPAYLVRRMHARELYQRQVNGWRREETDGVVTATIDVDRVADPPILDVDALLDEIRAAASVEPAVHWRLRVVERPRMRVLARVAAPALGWTAIAPADGSTGAPPEDAVEVGEHGLRNGLISVSVADDGSLAIDGGGIRVAGVGRLVDGGDVGDSYNHAPPATDRLVEQPEAVEVEIVARGPLVGEIVVSRRYAWPVGLVADLSGRSAETTTAGVRTHVELRAGEPFVRLRVAFENRAVDHRVRFHLPLPAPADRSHAEGQFAVVERGLTAEGGHGEHPLPTFPAHGFVAAGGVAVLLEHAIEYELVDGRELALTLLRATGLISRDAHPYRDEPAGPAVAAPGGQGLGLRSVAFAILPFGGERPDDRVLEAAERYRHPFLVTAGAGPADLPLRSVEGLVSEGAGVVLSALRRRGDALELRLVCERPEPTVATIRGPFRAARDGDLLGRPGAPLPLRDGVLEVPLGPWQIRTLWLEP